MSIPCSEGYLMNVFILDSHLMVTKPQVNLGKYLFSSHLIKEVINPRKRVLVLLSDFARLSWINTQPECTIFFVTSIDGGPQGDTLGLMYLFSNNSCSCIFSSSIYGMLILQGVWDTGATLGTSSKVKLMSFFGGNPGISSGMLMYL